MIKITETFKTSWKHNPISGHSWLEQGPSTGFEVSGGRFARTKHRTLAQAEKEKALRESMLIKYPFLMEA